MSDVILKRFQPIHLKLEGIGPFRSPFELSLTGGDGTPANFFLLVSRNGFGKTTILETIHSLMRLLEADWAPWKAVPLPDDLHPDFFRGGRAQFDIRVELESATRSLAAVLSLCFGTDIPSRTLTPSLLGEAQAEQWLPLLCFPNAIAHGYQFPDIKLAGIERTLFEDIRAALDPKSPFAPVGEAQKLPTSLYFTADRRITSPPDKEKAVQRPYGTAYRSAHRFLDDGSRWENSLDGLLTWYEWVGDGLFKQAADLVNNLLFANQQKHLDRIDRQRLEGVIQVTAEDGTVYEHGLSELSHGERSQMHLLVRSACHMAGSSILMIDELETHLHPSWQYQFMRMLKQWICKYPDLTVIATTHQPALIEAFAHERREEGLVKGGYIIEASEL